MPRTVATPSKKAFTFHPLTPDRWDDLVHLFGGRGACGGCWCMTWRLSRAEFDANKGDKNKRAFKKLVQKQPPGILAYDGKDPVGWCAIAPREDYVRLAQHRTLKPIDDKPVWSITCLFVVKQYRRQKLSTALIDAAARWAKSQGARMVEGYPTEPGQTLPDPFIYTGVVASFERAGFTEAKRTSATRAIMRKALVRTPHHGSES
jgi:GNAT superfamily N-acetyltransferase